MCVMLLHLTFAVLAGLTVTGGLVCEADSDLLRLLQDFPLLWLDHVVGDHSNVLGFSLLNSSHVFYLDFIRSLNLSWREGCRISPYPGPAVSSALLMQLLRAELRPLRCSPVGHTNISGRSLQLRSTPLTR